mgnify:CR=1 FL=1
MEAGRVHLELGQVDEGVEQLEEALRCDVEDINAWVSEGIVGPRGGGSMCMALHKWPTMESLTHFVPSLNMR